MLLGYLVLLFGGIRYFPPGQNRLFYTYLAPTTVGLIVICWSKGEKLRWRWGKD